LSEDDDLGVLELEGVGLVAREEELGCAAIEATDLVASEVLVSLCRLVLDELVDLGAWLAPAEEEEDEGSGVIPVDDFALSAEVELGLSAVAERFALLAISTVDLVAFDPVEDVEATLGVWWWSCLTGREG
jgi:hypothetical protein